MRGVIEKWIYVIGFLLMLMLAFVIFMKAITPLGAPETRCVILSNDVKTYLDSLNTVERGSARLKLDGKYKLNILREGKEFKIIAYFRGIAGNEGNNEKKPVYIDTYPPKGLETDWVREICIEKRDKEAEVLKECP